MKRQKNHRYTSDTEIVARFPKNAFEDVIVGFSTYKGNDLFTMRVVKETNDGNILWTTKGITLPVRHLIRARDALDAAVAAQSSQDGNGGRTGRILRFKRRPDARPQDSSTTNGQLRLDAFETSGISPPDQTDSSEEMQEDAR
jgi:hypothetical protein